MTRETSRRFFLSDAGVLVAATAVGLSLCRLSFEELGGKTTAIYPAEIVTQCIIVALPQLACWTFAVLFLALRSPRPEFRRLVRQPGMTAVTVAAGSMSFHAVVILAESSVHSWIRPLANYNAHWLSFLNIFVYQWIGGAWLAMALAGRWRRGRTWPDDLGIVVGLGWFAVYFAWWVRIFL